MNQQAEGRVADFLGLCLRAGRVISGQEACVDLIRADQAALALVDEAASDNTLKRLKDTCHSHGTPLYALSPGTLGHAIGKKGRMVIALRPDGMAQKLLTLLESEPRL